MNEKLRRYLDGVFSPYEDLHGIKELKEELLNDLQEKMSDFKKQGHPSKFVVFYHLMLDYCLSLFFSLFFNRFHI